MALGWEPRVGVCEGLPKTIERFGCQLANRQWVSSPKEVDSQCRRAARHGTKPRRSHLLKVGLSSVKRYLGKSHWGRSPSPGKAPGKRPKMEEVAGKLLEVDLKEQPFIILQERCDYVWAVSGVSVSRSLLCAAP